MTTDQRPAMIRWRELPTRERWVITWGVWWRMATVTIVAWAGIAVLTYMGS